MRQTGRISECHPDREHAAKGLCVQCYRLKYDAEHKETKKKSDARRRVADPKKFRVNNAKWFAAHKKERAQYDRTRRATNLNHRIADNLRRRLNGALSGKIKHGSAVRDLGCSITHFKLYMENQFESGMSWDNYGRWELDHVLPVSSFDLTDKSQLITAMNWLNYQPLWARDNKAKGHRI